MPDQPPDAQQLDEHSNDRFAQLWHEYRSQHGADSPHLAGRYFYELGRRHGRDEGLPWRKIDPTQTETASALP